MYFKDSYPYYLEPITKEEGQDHEMKLLIFAQNVLTIGVIQKVCLQTFVICPPTLVCLFV